MANPAGGGAELDRARLRRRVLVTVAIGVTVGLVVAVVTGGSEVLHEIERLPLGVFLVALALTVASWFGQGLGFAALTANGLRTSLVKMTAAFLGGDFPALVTPFGSGGIPAGVFCLTKEGISAGESSAIIAMHTMLTGAFFTLVGAVAAFVLPLHSSRSAALVWSGFAALAVVLVVTVWIALRPLQAVERLKCLLAGRVASRLIGKERSARMIESAAREAELFATSVKELTRHRPGAVVLSFAGLFASRVCLVLALPVIMWGLGWRGDIWPMLGTAVAGMALSIGSPTPGGSGAVEAATTALLATQVALPVAAGGALLWRGVTYYSEVLVGWAVFSRYLLMNGRKESGKEKARATSAAAAAPRHDSPVSRERR